MSTIGVAEQPPALLCASFPDRPALDMAVSHALLLRVARGELGPQVRLFEPGRTVAFGKGDVRADGFSAACAAARRHGFEPVVRLGGGHAAAYGPGALVFERIVAGGAVDGIGARYAEHTGRIVTALRRAGVPAQAGQLEGEYCAGAHSVNVAGRIKVAGVAQRAIRGATLVTAAVVVQAGGAVREVLDDVYGALGIAWRPSTAGAADDAVRGVTVEEVAATLAAEAGQAPATADRRTLELAAQLEAGHVPAVCHFAQ